MAGTPLARTTARQLLLLGESLWSWSLCIGCRTSGNCTSEDCPSRRTKQLLKYFEYLKAITASYEPEVRAPEQPALHDHNELLRLITAIKSSPDTNREKLTESIFLQSVAGGPVPHADQQRAVNLVVKVMFMVNCSALRQSSGLLEHGLFQFPWRPDVTLSEFIQDAFPMTNHPNLNCDKSETAIGIRAALNASKLQKRAGLSFQPTDDLRSHLKLDRKSNVVLIYHHTAFLKEHLRLTRDQPHDLPVSDCLKLGALPRQLVLEALDSLQKVLFPISDGKSRAILRSLVSSSASSFDPDCLLFEAASIRNPEERDIPYYYFGARLADLYEELENPTPHGLIEKWLERKSRARHVMLATLVGVLIAVVLGFAALAVSVYQAWVGYQAWKHPVPQPTSGTV